MRNLVAHALSEMAVSSTYKLTFIQSEGTQAHILRCMGSVHGIISCQLVDNETLLARSCFAEQVEATQPMLVRAQAQLHLH